MTTPSQYVYSKQQFVSDVSLNGSTTISSVNVTGNVGIGTTTPAYKLDVSGTTRLNGAVTTNTNNIDCGTGTVYANTHTASQSARFTSTDGYVTYINNDKPSGGNVEFNTSSPGSNLYMNTGHFYWANSGSILKSNGYVGIGTSNPTYPLHIATTASNKNGPFANDRFTLINSSGTASGYADNTYPGTYETRNDMAFYTPNSICIDTYIFTKMLLAYSDNRIKNNIVDIDDEKALSILRQIKPKTYEYIDKLENGNANVIGFIAQEIKEIIPKAITIMKKHIPNFMTICQVAATDVPNIVLVTSPVDLSWNPLHDHSGNAFIDAAGNACSDASGKKQFKVRLYDQSNNEIDCKTTDVLDKRSFLMDISGSKMENVSGALQDGYFLHGQEIDDFHNLDKAAIFTVVTAAVQDIDRIVQSQAAKIIELENKNATLESLVAQQQAQINAILAKIGGV